MTAASYSVTGSKRTSTPGLGGQVVGHQLVVAGQDLGVLIGDGPDNQLAVEVTGVFGGVAGLVAFIGCVVGCFFRGVVGVGVVSRFGGIRRCGGLG